MTRQDARDELVRLLAQVQIDSGRAIPQIDDNTIPFHDIPGFDSLNAEEVASSLEAFIHRDIRHHKDIFLDGKRLLTIGEMVERICTAYGIGGSPA